jgi:hypothetical protein
MVSVQMPRPAKRASTSRPWGGLGVTGPHSGPPELLTQLTLGTHQYAATHRRQIGAGTIDVETQHRKRRAIGVRFFSAACFSGPLQRRRDPFWILQGENALLQIERIASPSDVGRPEPGRVTGRCAHARSLSGCLFRGRLSHGLRRLSHGFTPDRHSMPTEMKRRKEQACSILRS